MTCSAKSSKRSGIQHHHMPVNSLRPAGRLGFADRPDAPRAVAGRGEAVGRDRDRLAVDAQLARPRADAGEARRVEQDAVALAADVLRSRRSVRTRSGTEVEADAVLVGVADEAQLVERLDRPRCGTGRPAGCILSSGREPDVADRPLPVAAAHGRVRVDHAEVRVHAEPGDEVRVGLVVDALVDAPVVDVAVARPDVAHRQRDLMDRILVERIELEHRVLPGIAARRIYRVIATVERRRRGVVRSLARPLLTDDREHLGPEIVRTPICDQLGIEFPLFAFSHCRDVVAAVSKAGGYGVLGALAFSPDQLEIELTWIDEHVDGKPYGVDFAMPEKFVGKGEEFDFGSLEGMIPAEHRDFVEHVLAEHDVPPLPEGVEGVMKAAGLGVEIEGPARSRRRCATPSRCS